MRYTANQIRIRSHTNIAFEWLGMVLEFSLDNRYSTIADYITMSDGVVGIPQFDHTDNLETECWDL